PSFSIVFFCNTTFGSACTTVAGISAPLSKKSCVMPILRPKIPFVIRYTSYSCVYFIVLFQCQHQTVNQVSLKSKLSVALDLIYRLNVYVYAFRNVHLHHYKRELILKQLIILFVLVTELDLKLPLQLFLLCQQFFQLIDLIYHDRKLLNVYESFHLPFYPSSAPVL